MDDEILLGCIEAGWGAANCLGRSTTLARGERLGAVVAGVAANQQAFGLSIVLESVPGGTMMQNVIIEKLMSSAIVFIVVIV